MSTIGFCFVVTLSFHRTTYFYNSLFKDGNDLIWMHSKALHIYSPFLQHFDVAVFLGSGDGERMYLNLTFVCLNHLLSHIVWIQLLKRNNKLLLNIMNFL